MNKKLLKKYSEYLKEALNPWKLKQGIKSFNRLSDEQLTIYGDLKDLSIELTKGFENINLPYSMLINFGGIELDLKIIKSNRYYSNIDWIKFLNGDYEIVVEVIENYDFNYLVSTVIHEIRHMIDFSDENLNNGLSSFDIDKNLRKYNIIGFNEFFTLVYISLEHELVARNNQIYPYIKFKNLSKEESLSILKNSFIYKALEKLRSFDYQKFIGYFDENILINITNNFIKDCLYDNETIIENLNELESFYKIWDEYFNEISIKWEQILMSEMDYIYERKVYNIVLSDDNILNSIWLKIKVNL
jgi:hypothetical protein